MWFYREHTQAHTPAALQRMESAAGVQDRGSYTVLLGRIRSQWAGAAVRDGTGLGTRKAHVVHGLFGGGPASHRIVPNQLPSTLPHTQIPTSARQLLILDLYKILLVRPTRTLAHPTPLSLATNMPQAQTRTQTATPLVKPPLRLLAPVYALPCAPSDPAVYGGRTRWCGAVHSCSAWLGSVWMPSE
jgi:hypothetical protein